MVGEQCQGILITAQTNFFWLTGGRPYINTAVEKACAELLVTEKRVYLIVNNIEAERLSTEELAGLPIEKVTYYWWEAQGVQDKIKECVGEGRVLTDAALGVKFARLRWDLTLDEQMRFKDTGMVVGKILSEVAYQIEPGNTELEIASLIKKAALPYGVNANVALVAVDDRTTLYRHPVPTEKKLDKYAMLVISGEKHGLYASATRLVHFGKVPAELEKRFQAVLQVDAAYLYATTPGSKLNEIFQQGIENYASNGFAKEWMHHHQGGMAGYSSREIKGDMSNSETVKIGQAYAWNPTIAGVKSEDTILVGNNGVEIITASTNFPVVEVEYKNMKYIRAGILVR
jgi:Xaa-Pro aminopeptidase